MAILVTGAAGFVGSFVAAALLARGEAVIGLDNVNSYYDVALKEARLARLAALPGFRFLRVDLADRAAMEAALAPVLAAVTEVVHLAAQAGVRYSMIDPYAYVASNVMGQVVLLEQARRMPALRHFVYASSSSVYGGNTELPFRETDRVDRPVSLYAATKRADELIGQAYSHLYGLPQTGLRFFTVYGPWGRPDMAYYSFARAIAAGEPITLYEGGRLKRDFTYIDDIVEGILGCLPHPPAAGEPARLLNIGNHRAEAVTTLVRLLEEGLGRRAEIRTAPRPVADVEETFADITAIQALAGFAPRTTLEEGIPRFVAWFRDWHRA
ncbi:NAD-dependent epimerase/dehydratase family protein [Falsiroseomonas selenitidurans]|uniref:NAD-dependent epimerase/dehydratase family protein n=1 Tax=Falsiroseomonas selenitidurans TaxID=2716335 RepID=A0ABX1E543_9PROT|nr:NAD-dependent epimerase/dehydratase family protein [Falsiroseomonas selenitidurans]NKC32216.1 NAD-dependent epimerase/dehydratase family protein [Falsiroseomonas selenitidurans]